MGKKSGLISLKSDKDNECCVYTGIGFCFYRIYDGSILIYLTTDPDTHPDGHLYPLDFLNVFIMILFGFLPLVTMEN